MPMALTLLREKERLCGVEHQRVQRIREVGEAWATRVEKLGSAVSFCIANANGSHIVEREGEEEKKRRKRNGRTEFFHAGHLGGTAEEERHDVYVI
jgi:hypothetical protein